MIRKPAIRWGVWSAIICLVAYETALALRLLFSGSELANSVFRVMAAPVVFLWGDAPEAMRIPMFISIFLLPSAVAFGVGVLMHRIFISR
jgi:hypothetical protein